MLLTSLLNIMDTPQAFGQVTSGPLRANVFNPRYFIDVNGNAVYLTGMHTWSNFQEMSPEDSVVFDYDAYLELLRKYHHNFIRLWVWEQAAWAPWTEKKIVQDPMPFLRTGPGTANDGLPKFDLTKFNEQYFERLHDRVAAARDRGIYVSVMLFQGWSIEKKGIEKRNMFQRIIAKAYKLFGRDPSIWDPNNPWNGHPFNGVNNVNGISGDLDHDGEGLEVHTLVNDAILELQEQYVRKVVDSVNDLDNVLYEISNESRGESTEWQFHMTRVIREYQTTKPRQHPVLMTWQWPGGSNDVLFQSPAEAASPGEAPDQTNYREDPPPAVGKNVIIADTDHLWGEGGNSQWVWKSFMRGLNPIFMDRIVSITRHPSGEIQGAEDIRIAMGQTRTYAERLNLSRVVPRPDLCSTTYCLADPGVEYVAYLPEGGSVFVELMKGRGPYTVEWFNLNAGEVTKESSVSSKAERERMNAPFQGPALVYLKAANDR
jgi:hypothetical protein